MLKCISIEQAKVLKAAFSKEGITIEKLTKMTPSEASAFFAKYLGEVTGKNVNLLFERALASNQRQAIADWVWKQFEGHKPLYKNIMLSESKAMRDAGLTVRQLKDMTGVQRTSELSKHIDPEQAKLLNERFEIARKRGTLANWEERVIGTKEVHADKKLQGYFAKLETLKDAGLLTPKQTERFLETFVSEKMGIGINVEQSAKISEMVERERVAFDSIRELDDWTGKNAQAVEKYFDERKALENYLGAIAGKDSVDIANDLVSTARNNILGSFRSLRNSALYQAIPSLERAITKRLVSAGAGEWDASLMDKISAKVSAGLKLDAEGRQFVKNQLALTLRVYNKTGYDLSRMENLATEPRYIGEEGERVSVIPWRDAVGTKEKVTSVVSRIAKATSVFPKWFAGGTDTVVAATTRAETTWLWSRERARLATITNKLPKGMTEKQYADHLLKEAYSFAPKDEIAATIKEQGIRDADFSNNTQPDGLADLVVNFRGMLKIKGVAVGKVLAPFAKISSTALSRGLKVAIPIDVAENIRGLYRATKEKDAIVRNREFIRRETALVGTLGLMGTAIVISALLGEDDYVPPYVMIRGRAEYEEAKARGAQAGSVRIGGKWIPLRYLPLIGTMVSSIMNARQVKSSGGNPVVGYLMASAASLVDLPVLTEGIQFIDNLRKATTAKETIDIVDNFGLNGQDLWEWARVRAVPSMLGRDLYDAVLPPDAKYDLFGREVDRGGAFRDDKTNDVLIELARLRQKGHSPVISEYRGDSADKIKNTIGDKEYTQKMNEFKQNYYKKVEKLISSSRYQRMSPEDRKKAIDKIRTKEIINKIQSIAKKL